MGQLIPNQTNSIVKFFNQETLKKERELIDSWDYEICNQYGMDCLFVSQKSKFPKVRKTPIQNDLFFHAYGEISKPEYNEPFPTRVYVQFTEDLFAINGFGLNADLNTTLVFNKTSFALDGALAMADNKTINKQFKVKAEVPSNERDGKYVILNYKSPRLKFKARFNWFDKAKSKGDEVMISGELFEFTIDPENYVKADVLNTFKRRYSASKYIEKYAIYFKCKNDGINPLNGYTKLSGTCIANFVVKNPWKAYSEHLNKITPSVGDIVLLNGIDDNIIKLELTEVESENKTAQGISPLLGSYSFKCTAKPYIADNDSSPMHDPITAPTDINAHKLIIQTVINNDASKIADNISTYEKLYTDDMGLDFTEDDVYGGYDLEPQNGINTPQKVPVKHDDIVRTNERIYDWNMFKNKKVQITTGDRTISYTPDELYTYLRNLFDSNYTNYLVQAWKPDEISSVDYSMFDTVEEKSGWQKCKALNVELWYNELLDDKTGPYPIKYKDEDTGTYSYTISAYTETDKRLRQILNNEYLFEEFIEANSKFLNFTNTAAYNNLPQKYEIPIMHTETTSTYFNVIDDKKDAIPIVIDYSDVYELTKIPKTEISSDSKQYKVYIDRYVQHPTRHYNLKTDLYDIEQYNLGSIDFAKVVKETTPNYNKWKNIVVKKMNGPLIEIFKFEDRDNSRLATNGEVLFFETTHDNEIYRTEIASFESDIIPQKAGKYAGKTIPMNKNLNWIEADDNGIYFNNAYGKRVRLYTKKEDIEFDSMSHLNYENDISSPQNSFILTFNNSKFYLIIEPTEEQFILKLGQ